MSISGIGSGPARVATASAGGPSTAAAPAAQPAKRVAAPATTSGIAYDEKDTDRDGIVSMLEKVTYALKHPGEQTGSLFDVEA